MIVFILWLGCVVFVAAPIGLLAYSLNTKLDQTQRAWLIIPVMILWLIVSNVLIRSSVT